MKRRNVQVALVMFLLGALIGGAVFKSLLILFAAAVPLLVGLSIMGIVGHRTFRRFRRF